MKQKLNLKSVASVLIMLVLPLFCSAASAYQYWDGITIVEPQAADLDVHYDYIVNQPGELIWLSQNSDAQNGYVGKKIYLNISIDLGGYMWTPIGSAAHPFEGEFHGGYEYVKGLRLCRGTDGVGFFGHIGPNGYVHEFGLTGGDMTVSSKRRVGTLAGVCAGRIEHVWSMTNIMSAGNIVGGLVGELTATGSLTDAHTASLIIQAKDTVGSVVGYNNGGTITRVYSNGYAKNGNGFVGIDNNGIYSNCYYDRKLYYQEPGYLGDGLTPMDKTEEMYHLFGANPNWIESNLGYPMLSGMEDTDEAGIATLPILLDTVSIDPVNHANDLTENFQIAMNGPVVCEHQTPSNIEWLSYDETTYIMTVTRPCTETDMLVNINYSTNNEYHRVVYFRPRRLEDLLAGEFQSRRWAFCHDEIEPSKLAAYVTKVDASRGWEDGEYHYMVVRFGMVANDTVALDTVIIADTQADYDNWFNNYTMRTDSTGEFILRCFVHDDGCIKDWIPAKGQFPYTVYEEFDPGRIEDGRDTLYLDVNPQLVTVNSIRPASGGDTANIEYAWYLNGVLLDGWTTDSLKNFPITTAGTYVFNRWAGDGKCSGEYVNLSDSGEYVFVVFDPFDPGAVAEISDLTFCELDGPNGAKSHKIEEQTAASGGCKPYHYQWFIATATDTTAIAGATNPELELSNYPMVAGGDYTFVRKVKDDTRFTDWTLSDNKQALHVMAELTAGAIEDATRDKICTNSTSATLVISEVTAATGEGTLQYRWLQIRGSEEIELYGATAAELNIEITITDDMVDKTYTYVREVKHGNCDWKRSDGAIVQYYGRINTASKSFTVCEDEMPYTMAWYDSDHVRFVHTFNADGESHTFRDEAVAGCPVDTIFTINVEKAPAITVPSESSVCISTGNIYLTYEYENAGDQADMFYIRYSNDMAAYVGRPDTTGYVTSNGTIVLRNMSNIGVGDIYLDLQVGNSGGVPLTEGVCLGKRHRITLDVSLDGYVHTMHDRIIFVDNNPSNGEVAGSKLKFVRYQWYKNGILQEGQTGQYYHEGGNVLNGVFYAVLTDTTGVSYRSCDVEVTNGSSPAPELRTRVYPVPVSAGEPFSIEVVEGSATIVSSAGTVVKRVDNIVGSATINAPSQEGWYYVRIEGADGSMDTHKLIVK